MPQHKIQKLTTSSDALTELDEFDKKSLLIPSSANPSVPSSLLEDLELADELKQEAYADNTMLAYQNDWEHFVRYCKAKNVSPLPALPETIEGYISSMQRGGYKYSTISRRQVIIRRIYRLKGLSDPFKDGNTWLTLRGIRRKVGVKQEKKDALLLHEVIAIIEQMEDRAIDIRDKALLLTGFWSAMRPEELVNMQFRDLSFSKRGLIIQIPKSKTDQEGTGQEVYIPYRSYLLECAIRALHEWFELSGINEGFVFRSMRKGGRIQERGLCVQNIARMIKSRVSSIGKDPSNHSNYSLRRGFAKTADIANVDLRRVQVHLRHNLIKTTEGYMDEQRLFEQNPIRMIPSAR